MKALLLMCGVVDRLNITLGKMMGWLILVATLVSALNAVLRKAADLSSNSLLEIQWYLFGAVFLLGAAYTLQQNAHVRIDILSSRFSERTRAWIDIAGHVFFTLPLIGFVVLASWDFAYDSFLIAEYSPDAGGLIRWPAKALIPLGFLLLGLQVICEIIRKIAFLRGQNP
ncbi:MAG TPA: TRAP transporter small permease subunit [Limnobacter sp.]|nr:TRAP transporter small permease subunit [Limnobacter sp.]